MMDHAVLPLATFKQGLSSEQGPTVRHFPVTANKFQMPLCSPSNFNRVARFDTRQHPPWADSLLKNFSS